MKLIEERKKIVICDYCLLPKPTTNTKKIGLTKSFSSEICSDCIIFHLGERNRSHLKKIALEEFERHKQRMGINS